MISNTEYQIKNGGERYTVRVEYESVRGCFRKITQIIVYSDAAVITCDSDGYALHLRPNIHNIYIIDFAVIRRVAIEGKQKLLHEINDETVTVRDNIFDKPGIENEIISTKELPKFRWFRGKRDDR